MVFPNYSIVSDKNSFLIKNEDHYNTEGHNFIIGIYGNNFVQIDDLVVSRVNQSTYESLFASLLLIYEKLDNGILFKKIYVNYFR